MIDAKHIMQYIDEYVTAIELPSDEQIDDFADHNTTTLELYVGFKSGAKWMRGQIEQAYDKGHSDAFHGKHKDYYNETYKGGEQ